MGHPLRTTTDPCPTTGHPRLRDRTFHGGAPIPTVATVNATARAAGPHALIRPIAPAPTAAFDTRGNLPNADLFPAESRVIAGAVASRRQEFATARTCARKAMELLRVHPAAVLPGPSGEP